MTDRKWYHRIDDPELQLGDIVEVRDAYGATHNGLYFVDRVGGAAIDAKRDCARLQKKIAGCSLPYRIEGYKKELAAAQERIASFAAIPDPGQPTAEVLEAAAAYMARMDSDPATDPISEAPSMPDVDPAPACQIINIEFAPWIKSAIDARRVDNDAAMPDR